MNAILKKYRVGMDEYLVYDTTVNTDILDGRTVRLFCSQNFGLSTRAILVGPLEGQNGLLMKAYSYEGEELPIEGSLEDLSAFLLTHVADNTHPEDESIVYVGRVYVYMETWDLGQAA